jgi:hypothetical protein
MANAPMIGTNASRFGSGILEPWPTTRGSGYRSLWLALANAGSYGTAVSRRWAAAGGFVEANLCVPGSCHYLDRVERFSACLGVASGLVLSIGPFGN